MEAFYGFIIYFLSLKLITLYKHWITAVTITKYYWCYTNSAYDISTTLATVHCVLFAVQLAQSNPSVVTIV